MNAISRLATRRRVLKGMMGGAAVTVGLPFLDGFLNSNGTALAATNTQLPVVFGSWFWGCGLTPGRWEPDTVGANYKLPVELKKLAAFHDQMSVISGMKAFLDGKPPTPHQTGHQAILTGHVPKPGVKADYASLDVLISDAIGSKTRFRSLEVTGSGNARDSLSRRGANVLNPSEVSPAALYARIFGPEFKDPNAAAFTPDARVMVRKSVLSSISEERAALAKELGTADKARLDQYFTSLRQLENQLDIELQKPAPMAACSTPGKPEETLQGLEVNDAVKNVKLMSELIAHALACGQTRVFNVAFADATSSVRKPGETATHHILTHEEAIDEDLGYQPRATWFNDIIMGSLADTATALRNIKEGDGTLLDRTLLMASSETGFAKIHSLENIPMMIIGKAGGRIKTGVHVQAKGDPATRVGLTVQQVMGVPVSSWGTDSLETSKTITELLA
jgi:hypothetical protein